METICEKLCERIIGGGYLDWKKLKEHVNEITKNSDYTVDDILEEYFYLYSKSLHFNSLMYVVFTFYERIIKEKMSKFYPEVIDEIFDYEINIHVNYLDSSLDDICWNYELKDFDNKEVVDEVLKSWNILGNVKEL